MRKRIFLFSLSFFILQFICPEVRVTPTGLLVKAGYCATQIRQAPGDRSEKAASPEEKKEANPYEWDFGQVKPGVVIKHDFILKNQSNDILEITNIHTSCGCTVSESAKKSLMPLESTKITVSFDSKGYSGEIKQFVYVHTDNADLAIVKFTIKAQVIK